jgi:hypothetical protein
VVQSRPLSLDRARCEAGDDTALEEQDEDDKRQRDDDGRRRDLPPRELGGDVRAGELRDGHRCGQFVLLRHEGAGEEELVPRLDEEQDSSGEDARRSERRDDAHEGLHARAAVHPRGFLQLQRQFAEEGVERPDAQGQREGDVRQDERPVVIRQVPGIELAEERADDGDTGEHRDAEDERQDEILTGELQPGERVRADRADQE